MGGGRHDDDEDEDDDNDDQYMYIYTYIYVGASVYIQHIHAYLHMHIYTNRHARKPENFHFQFFPLLSPSVEEKMFGNGFAHAAAQSKFTTSAQQFSRSVCAIVV